MLEQLRAAGLQASIKKCEFHVTRTRYLEFILITDGIEVDPEKTCDSELGSAYNCTRCTVLLGILQLLLNVYQGL